MTKKEMIEELCQEHGYTEDLLVGYKYAELKKLLMAAQKEVRERNSDDDADMWPNGRFFDEDDEDSL